MTEPSLFDLVSAPAPPRRAAKPTGMPEAAKRSLEAKGLRDPNTGAMRKAAKRRCGECRRNVWRGIDREFGGQARDCDPRPLTAAGEVEAILDGVRTFDLQHRPGYGHVLDLRDGGHIKTWPAGISGMDVLAEHAHNKHDYQTGKSQLLDSTPVVVHGDNPPF